ncbi:MAG: hypothetical protein IJY62_00725 [Clostridia bacterium]|nr:hypothetical protein [Clostridia bacterium]
MKINHIKYIILSVLHNTAILFSSGAIVQTFFLTMGVSAERVSVYASLVQVIQVAAMCFCLFFGDGVKNIKKFLTVLFFIFPVIFISELAVLIFGIGGAGRIYGVVLIGSIVSNFALGLYNIICYKMPYFIMDMRDYGKLGSVSGILSGSIGIGATALLSFFVKNYNYQIVMSVAFSIGTVLWLGAALVNHSYRVKDPESLPHVPENRLRAVVEVLKHPLFYKTAVPHILRGVGVGILSLAVVIGTSDGILNTKTSTYMTVFTSLATIVGYVLYLLTEKFFRIGNTLAAFGILMVVLLPFMTVFKNLIVFYIVYFSGYTLLTVVNMCVPMLVYECVPYEMMGTYTSLRMMIFTLGQALPGFFMNGLFSLIGTFGVMILTGGCFAVSSVWFTLVLKKKEPKEKQADAVK